MCPLKSSLIVLAITIGAARMAHAADPPAALPTLDFVLDGYVKINSSEASGQSMYTLYLKKATHDLLAVLPLDFEDQLFLFANSLTGGFPTAGSQAGSEFAYWKRNGDRLVLMNPQFWYRTTGDIESQRSRDVLYSDKVRLDIPILAETSDGAPVIDLGQLLIDRSVEFHSFNPGKLETRLGTIADVKVFSQNLLISVQMPWLIPNNTSSGRVITLTYSMALLPETPEYAPRPADVRVGYFQATHEDISQNNFGTGRQRYIQRWAIEKADSNLTLSPPSEPIIFYIDHKTPIRYRRWVRDGMLEWNKAFERVGIVNAIEVYQQDARTGSHMEKHPADAQYNFFVWNSSNWGFAMGPSRADPRTGQILDADIIFHDGWIRRTVQEYRVLLAESMMEGASVETLNWLASRPDWDPRVRLAEPSQREIVQDQLQLKQNQSHNIGVSYRGTTDISAVTQNTTLSHQACYYAQQRSLDIALARFSLLDLFNTPSDGSPVDVPGDFIGKQVKDIAMHEFGHILGLRHNFKASTVYSLDEINSEEWATGDLPISGSVMDYNAVNYTVNEGQVQGPYFMTVLGPYDFWAIRYGYAEDSKLDEILLESGRPEHVYLTDEDLYGPDPAARTRDLGSDPLGFVEADMEFIQAARTKLLERTLKKGESFQPVRDAYLTLLALHGRDIGTALRYVGGLHITRERVGDSDRTPTEPVSPETQRRAMQLISTYAFRDEAFGLTPELLASTYYDKWFDAYQVPQGLPDPQLPIHDLVLGIQASAISNLLNPTRLTRIIDTERRVAEVPDGFTLAELLTTLQREIWSELQVELSRSYSNQDSFISSFRRSLQHEHLERSIDLILSDATMSAVSSHVASLTAHLLRTLRGQIAAVLETSDSRLDIYSTAHLEDSMQRIDQALNAMYVRD